MLGFQGPGGEASWGGLAVGRVGWREKAEGELEEATELEEVGEEDTGEEGSLSRGRRQGMVVKRHCSAPTARVPGMALCTARCWKPSMQARRALACGEGSKERFISETKAYFFRQDCLYSYFMTSPWPQAQSGMAKEAPRLTDYGRRHRLAC